MHWLAGPLLPSLVSLRSEAAAAGTIMLGVLKFGTDNWKVGVITTNGFDRADGFDREVVDLANAGAATVALQTPRPLALRTVQANIARVLDPARARSGIVDELLKATGPM